VVVKVGDLEVVILSVPQASWQKVDEQEIHASQLATPSYDDENRFVMAS